MDVWEEIDYLKQRVSVIYDVVSALGATGQMPDVRDTWHLSAYIQTIPVVPPAPEYTASDYVQDGLVSIWDGLENTGWNQHSDTATGWKDLVGGYVTGFNGSSRILVFQDSVVFNFQALQLSSIDYSTLTARTVEIVFADDSGDASNRVYLEDNSNNQGFSLQSNVQNYRVSTNVRNYHMHELSAAYGSPVSIHWTFTQDSSSNIWINGNLAKTANVQFSNFQYIGIGLRVAAYSRIYCIRVYNRVLTPSEIAYNDTIDKARFNYLA